MLHAQALEHAAAIREESARWRRAGAREERQKVRAEWRTRARRAPRAALCAAAPAGIDRGTVIRARKASLRSSLCPWSDLCAALWERLLAGVVSPRLLLVAAHSLNAEREDVRRAGVRVLNGQEEQLCCSHAHSHGGAAI